MYLQQQQQQQKIWLQSWFGTIAITIDWTKIHAQFNCLFRLSKKKNSYHYFKNLLLLFFSLRYSYYHFVFSMCVCCCVSGQSHFYSKMIIWIWIFCFVFRCRKQFFCFVFVLKLILPSLLSLLVLYITCNKHSMKCRQS